MVRPSAGVAHLSDPRRPRNSGEVFRTHEGIAAAIESGDQELARHPMRSHLQAVGAAMG